MSQWHAQQPRNKQRVQFGRQMDHRGDAETNRNQQVNHK